MSHSQTEKILQALQQGRELTPKDALTEFGCMRLAARVEELRKRGYDIVSTVSQDPQTRKRYAHYHLKMATQGTLF